MGYDKNGKPTLIPASQVVVDSSSGKTLKESIDNKELGNNVKNTLSGGETNASPSVAVVKSELDKRPTAQQVNEALGQKADKTAVNSKQDKLVSGQNVKTIGGMSILGSGNIPLPSDSGVNITQTVNPSDTANAPSSKAVADYVAAHAGQGGGASGTAQVASEVSYDNGDGTQTTVQFELSQQKKLNNKIFNVVSEEQSTSYNRDNTVFNSSGVAKEDSSASNKVVGFKLIVGEKYHIEAVLPITDSNVGVVFNNASSPWQSNDVVKHYSVSQATQYSEDFIATHEYIYICANKADNTYTLTHIYQKPKVEEPQKEQLVFSAPPKIYTVYNDAKYSYAGNANPFSQKAGANTALADELTRQYSAHLYIDKMVRRVEKELDFHFRGRKDHYPFYSKANLTGYSTSSIAENGQLGQNIDIAEDSITLNIEGENVNATSVVVTHVSVKNSLTKNKQCRLLCIGDSTTNGTGAQMNRPYDNSPRQYWAWVKALFEMDKIDAENIGYDMMALGNLSVGTFDLQFSNYLKTNVRAFACGVGGSNAVSTNIVGWLKENIIANVPNPFYTENGFSINSWLAKHRTCDDNGNRLYFDTNQTTRGTAGANNKGYLADGTETDVYIGSVVTDTEAYDVCLPTHIVVQLGFNGFELSSHQQIISDIHSEYPDIPIILQILDTPGTMFPSLYCDFIGDADVFGLDFTRNGNNHANFYTINESLKGLVNDNNNVYYSPAFYVCPSVYGAGVLHQPSLAYLTQQVEDLDFCVHRGSVPYLHPNCTAHAAAGYQLYSLLKYLLATKN